MLDAEFAIEKALESRRNLCIVFRHFPDMPRYYFNVHNVSPSAGDLGEELPDNEAAWRRATVIAGAALFKDDGMFRPDQEWALEVTDEARKPIYLFKSQLGKRSSRRSAAETPWQIPSSFVPKQNGPSG